jgi:hypothetical protein
MEKCGMRISKWRPRGMPIILPLDDRVHTPSRFVSTETKKLYRSKLVTIEDGIWKTRSQTRTDDRTGSEKV